MKNRSPSMVVFLSSVTLGIYYWIWIYKTKKELVEEGAKIPPYVLFYILFVNWYFLFKFSSGLQAVTKGSVSVGGAFTLLILLGPFGAAFIQKKLNKQNEPE